MISQDTRERLQEDSSRVMAAMRKDRDGPEPPDRAQIAKDAATTRADIVRGPENDPFGKSPNEPGAKLDFGKLQADSLLGAFAHALEAVAEVGEFGAVKYSLHGWVSVPDGIKRYSDAMMRHWLAIKKGETIDKDSGLPHRAHLAWNALAVLELELRQRDS